MFYTRIKNICTLTKIYKTVFLLIDIKFSLLSCGLKMVLSVLEFKTDALIKHRYNIIKIL